MKKKIILISLLLLASTGCGFNGKYRYPCQDPKNWQKPECQRPACEVDGACTDTLLGFDPSAETTIAPQETVAP